MFFLERRIKIIAQNRDNQASGKINLLFGKISVLFAFILIAFCYLLGLIFFRVFVMPKFTVLFEDLNVTLPLPTRIFLSPYGVALILLVAGLPFLYLLLLCIKRPKWSPGIIITLVIIILAQFLFLGFISVACILPIFQASTVIGGG